MTFDRAMLGLWIPYAAMQTLSPGTSPRPSSASIVATLQHSRKDWRWRKGMVGGMLLFAFVYGIVLLVSSSAKPCPTFGPDADTAYCRLAAWSSSVTDRQSRSGFSGGDWVPSSSRRRTTSIDKIVFGIGSTADSWALRSQYINLWWKPNVTRGFLWMDREPKGWEEGSVPFKVSENTSRFGYTHVSNSRSSIRIARIVTESFRLNLPNVDWFVMGDDDTLFFTENLAKVLGKYDHRKFYYIGANSEDMRQSSRHHYGLAFGGGGFAISYALAKALSEIQDECLERYTGLYGSDERVKACASELGVPLTREPGFHQLDVHGDISGLLAAHPVSPIVSLHHLEEFDPIFPGNSQLDGVARLMKAAKVNPANLFQQSICYDEEKRWSISVAWGYVVEIYEGFVPPRVLEVPAVTFISWSWRREFNAFTMDTRPMGDLCKRPTRFFMVEAKTEGTGNEMLGTSSYERLLEFEKENCSAKALPMGTVETVRVEDEQLSEDWFSAPRRQCCRVTRMEPQSISIHVGACGASGTLIGRKSVETKRKSRRSLR